MVRMNRSGIVLVGLALLAGCGAEEGAEATQDGVVGEGMELATVAAVEGEYTAQAYCDDVTTWDAKWANFESEVIAMVNQRRAAGATCGGVSKPAVPAVVLDTRLRCAARKHSKDMAVNNFFSHTGTGNTLPWDRMKLAGYTYNAAGENIAANQDSAAAVMASWMNSTGHCNNIMNGSFKKLGVGYYYRASGAAYKHYWTQDFGAP